MLGMAAVKGSTDRIDARAGINVTMLKSIHYTNYLRSAEVQYL